MSFGTDLVGDAYTGSNAPVPDNDPMDCNGHGSHVAGIIAAQPNRYGFTGAAPDVTLGSYRVLGCEGHVQDDVLIAAYNKAFEDGANIISASIVSANGWTEEPWGVVVSRIVEQGVPCTVSAGNDGDHGLFYSSNAANAKQVTAVASFDNVVTPTLLYVSRYSVDGGDERQFGYAPATQNAWDVTMPVYATSLDATLVGDACNPLPDNTPDLSRSIVLIRRGGCLFVTKAGNAVAKGAKYILIYNNLDGAFSPDLAAAGAGVNAAGMVTGDVGATWVSAIKAGKTVTLSMVYPYRTESYMVTANNTLTGGALALMTSWGPTWEMDFKPQIGAPGGNILSTYPVAKGGYAVLSGTSMSCPITAGIIALISEVRGTLDPELITNLLSANGNPQLFNDGTRFHGRLAPAAQQGGGLVQAYDAAYATTMLEPSSLSFNDTDHFERELGFKLSNTGSTDITYQVTHVPATTMYTLASGSIYPMPFPNEAVEAYASLTFTEQQLTLRGGDQRTVGVVAQPPPGLDAKRLALWSGYIVVNGTDGTSLSLPYQGLTGSLHRATVLAADQTWMTTSNDTTHFVAVPANTTYTLPARGTAGARDVVPAVAVNLALGSRKLRVDVVPLTTCPPGNLTTEAWGRKTIGQPSYSPWLWNPRGVASYFWDGRLDSGAYAPEGRYRFVVRALRIYGDEGREEEWDVSEAPAFRIRYAK